MGIPKQVIRRVYIETAPVVVLKFSYYQLYIAYKLQVINLAMPLTITDM